MKITLFETYSRTFKEFTPLNNDRVGMYTCGPTVYDYAHIGNLRTYIFEDILRRVLEFNGFSVNHVMNITDVGHLTSDQSEEDRIEKGARRTGLSAWEVADLYTNAFKRDISRLNIQEPDIWCKATEHIQDQIDLIGCIERNGYTYSTNDGIYFDTSKLAEYGYLARINVDGLKPGVRIDLREKRNPTDFALWKFSPEKGKRQMEWDSPWGLGFPGWHIECTAMAAKYLGPFFDIHCGGEDHIMVHHVNEIAQSQACYKTNLANFWMHGYFLQINKKRMGKSQGNFITLQTLINKGYDPMAWRYYCLGAHYRSKLHFSWRGLDSSAKAYERLCKMIFDIQKTGRPDGDFVSRVTSQLNDDLNTPKAIATIWDLMGSKMKPSSKKATIAIVDKALGLNLLGWKPRLETPPKEVEELLLHREKARMNKNWALADALREEIRNLGYDIEDSNNGSSIKLIKE